MVNGVDTTRDDLYAINADTGEDNGGYEPIAVGGSEGVVLPRLTEQEKNEIELFVSSIVHHSKFINDSGEDGKAYRRPYAGFTC